MTDRNGHWRFNSNISWHYFCSVCSSEGMYKETTNKFMRYHHVRTQLYFSVCTMEALMNAEMRRHMQEMNTDEAEIFSTLRKEKFVNKIRKWPTKILDKDFEFASDFWQFYERSKAVRDEITHPKNHDHSIYEDLDNSDPTFIQKAIAGAIVDFHESKGKPWPYWLAGWNYVGLNGNPSWPFESNNINGFYYSLLNFGFNRVPTQMQFEEHCMSTRVQFGKLCEALDALSVDIEPISPRFPQTPRLTRRWWDQQYLIAEHQRTRASM